MKKILLLILLLSPLYLSAQKKNLTLEDIWTKPDLAVKQVPGFRSMADGTHYTNTITADGSIIIIRCEFSTGNTVDTILDGRKLVLNEKKINFSDYSFSNDESYILLTSESEPIFRHSTKAFYYLYNRKSAILTQLPGSEKVMYATISPDNKKVAYVRNNNLYITELATGTETSVTTDGKKNEIINGATDWVYEEEFSMSTGFQWNKTSTSIAYFKFDESSVKEFNLTTYGTLYPQEEKYKYPKAGEENSKVSVYIYHLDSKKNIKAETGNEWEYLPRITWTQNPEIVSIQRCNRLQNTLELVLCSTSDGKCKSIIREESKSYIDVKDDLKFLSNGRQLIWTSRRSGYNHIYLYNINGTLEKQITSGNFDIISYYGYDEKSKYFYYQSAEPTPMERRINKTNINNKTIIISPVHGTSKATFSNSFNYFVNTWSSYGNPYTCTVRNSDGKEMRVLENNNKARKALSEFNISSIESIQAKTRDGVLLNGWMIKPPDFNPAKKYPVLFHLYGGIGKQTVLNMWQSTDYLWHEMMAEKGYIIVSFDNRGTPGRGMDFASANYKNMGHIEVLDQLDAVEYIKSQPFTDTSRLGVWGWSFGGYMTSLLMTKGNGVFKCGIAVAPVTNWRFYDSIYTERFLQLPKDNASGYDENSPINFAKDLQGKLLVVHGSTDDNVHMQNTMEFTTALVKAGKAFDMFIYPNKSHSISGATYRRHLYDKMTNYILENL